jgi:hypothetical protein
MMRDTSRVTPGLTKPHFREAQETLDKRNVRDNHFRASGAMNLFALPRAPHMRQI